MRYGVSAGLSAGGLPCRGAVTHRERREDLPWLETEFDEEFKQWIKGFPKEELPRIYKLLEKYEGKADIIIFRARKETEDYLAGLYTAAAKETCFEQQP